MSDPRRIGAIPASRCECGHFAKADGEITVCRFCDCDHHRPAGPYRGHNPQDPPGAEAALQSFSDALEPALEELTEASNQEVEAELARDAAKRYWLLHATCPPVGVFDGVRTTVAQRDAWVEEKIADKEMLFRLATERRKAAAKKLAVLERQSSVQQSISKSVGESYRGTGDGGRW